MGDVMQFKPVIQQFIAQAHTRSLPARHNIIHAGDPARGLFLILEGSVSVLLEDDHGREIVLAYLDPGAFFGEMCLFPEQKVRTAIVRTREPTLVAELAYEDFRNFCQAQPQIMLELAEQLAVRLRDTNQRLADLAFLDVAGRIAHILMELTRRVGTVVHPRGLTVRVSRQELARNAGCSREMAGRVLKRLEEDGLLISEGRNITVVGPQKPAARLQARPTPPTRKSKR